MNTNNTPTSIEGPPATTSNAYGHAAADAAAPSPTTVHAPSSTNTNTNTNYNNNNPAPAANAANQDAKVKPTSVESPPANENDCIEAQLDEEAPDVSETLASLPQPILPKPPRPFNVADYDEGEDAKLKSEAKQAMADASDAAASSFPQPQPNRLKPPHPFNIANYDDGEDAKLKSEANQSMAMAMAAASSLPQPQPNRLEPPRPFNIADYDEGKDAKLKSEAKQVDALKSMDSHIIVPTEEDMADGAALDPAISRDRRTKKQLIRNSPVDLDAYLELGGNVEPLQSEDEKSEELSIDHVTPFNSELPVLKAYIVEEESEQDVVIATHVEPTLPWWKQRRTKLLLGAVFVVFAVMAIALGVAFSSRTSSDTTDAIVVVTVDSSNSPSVSDIPSASPSKQSSTLPSSSLSPSSSPTSCGDIIVSGRQAIDLGLGDPQFLSLAVDGSNMVLTVKDGQGNSSILHIMFYSLINDVWVRSSRFEQDHDRSFSSVAISGKTSFVGLPYWGDNDEGMVLVYAQDEFGFWKETEDLSTLDTEFSTNGGFGKHADISGDLACVEDSLGNTYLFHRDGDTKWIQFDMIANEAYRCSVDGDTLAISNSGSRSIQLYTYISGGIVPLQDPIQLPYGIRVSSLHLDGNNLAIAEDVDYDLVGEGISIYHRDEVNSTFSFLQQLNISTPWNGYDSIDKDLLVAGADDEPIHIFSEQNGYWVETSALDEIYGSYTLSGRNLLAWRHRPLEIHYYNLDRCTQAWPTQAPSLSLTPSSPPTKTPSSLPSTSPSSSASTSPTETCHWIIVTIIYDIFPTVTSWVLQSIGLDGTEVEVKSYSENDWVATSHTETACLTEGEYEFVIYNIFGLCCDHGEGHYNVTTIDGQLIAEGAEFEDEEATRFSIPFVPAPSISPSQSISPTTSLSPTVSRSSSMALAPSASTSPTASPSSSPSTSPTGSYCITVTVVYDDYPTDTSWELQSFGLDGSEVEVKSYVEANEDATSHTETVCLTEGEYEFVILDSFYGLFGEGHYNVTTIDGIVIAEGGEFRGSEATRFSIPFVPAP